MRPEPVTAARAGHHRGRRRCGSCDRASPRPARAPRTTVDALAGARAAVGHWPPPAQEDPDRAEEPSVVRCGARATWSRQPRGGAGTRRVEPRTPPRSRACSPASSADRRRPPPPWRAASAGCAEGSAAPGSRPWRRSAHGRPAAPHWVVAALRCADVRARWVAARHRAARPGAGCPRCPASGRDADDIEPVRGSPVHRLNAPAPPAGERAAGLRRGRCSPADRRVASAPGAGRPARTRHGALGTWVPSPECTERATGRRCQLIRPGHRPASLRVGESRDGAADPARGWTDLNLPASFAVRQAWCPGTPPGDATGPRRRVRRGPVRVVLWISRAVPGDGHPPRGDRTR